MILTMLSDNFLIKKPLVSEKSTDLASLGKYVFVVDIEARARQIKEEIERIYKVNVVDINVSKMRSRFKNLKKAIVTLKTGEKIDIVPE